MVQALETVPAFYEDAYRTELMVWVDGFAEDERFGPALVFSETLCHPHGGGQKGDRATLELPAEDARALGAGAVLPIVDTRRAGGRLLHVLGAALDPAAAEEVLVGSKPYLLKLDWEFRYRQMRLHSAAHLLHCFVEQVLERAVNFPETSDLQPEYGLNRYEQKELLTHEEMAAVLERLNAFTAEGHAITTYPDDDKPDFRYWQCADWVIPCGGTHLANTREIGPVKADLSLKRGRTGMTFRVTGP